MMKKFAVLFVLFFVSFHFSLLHSETIRILAVGNSFSEDAVENYLYDLGKADNVTFIIGNMYIASCSLSMHWENAENNESAYSYRKIDALGKKTIVGNISLSQAIADENWDYITFQQVSQESGKYNGYFPYLSNLKNYVAGLATNSEIKFALHATWAYAQNTTHGGFVNYGKDQMTMYNAIITASSSAASTAGVDIIIPSGTAIQNARTSFIGDNLCRDGYHLDLGVGRYTAACTWYERLTGNSVIGNSYVPSNLTTSYIEVAQQAAHSAVVNPLIVTDLSDIYHEIDPETFSTSSPVNIDFGSATTVSASPWNNLTGYAAGSFLTRLKDMTNADTPFKIEVVDAFGGVNSNGPTNGLILKEWLLPAEATSDSFFSSGEQGSSFLLSNLNPNKAYNFLILATRLYTTDNRETCVVAEGITTVKDSVDSSLNPTRLIELSNIQPQIDGTIKITVRAGANNENGSKYCYMNALQITMGEVIPVLPNPDTFILTEAVNINFGTSASTSSQYWNNISSYMEGTFILGLKEETNRQTPFKIEVIDRFGGVNTDGPTSNLELNGWSIPKEVASDSFYGNAGTPFGGLTIVTGSFLLSNLNTNKTYDFSMLTSRLYVNDNRETYIFVEGENAKKDSVNSSKNLNTLVELKQIRPKQDGTIKITIGAGENNNNGNNFFYINALRIAQGEEIPTFDDSQIGNTGKVSLRLSQAYDMLEVLGMEDSFFYNYEIYRLDGSLAKKGKLSVADNKIETSSLQSSCYVLKLSSLILSESIQLKFIKGQNRNFTGR